VRLRDHRCSIPVCGVVVVRYGTMVCSWCATRVGSDPDDTRDYDGNGCRSQG